MKFQVGADIAHRILFHDHFTDAGIDGLQPLDQGQVGARQGTAGQLYLDQAAQRGQLFDSVIGQFRR